MKPFQLAAVLQQRQLQKDEAQRRLSEAEMQRDRVAAICKTKEQQLKAVNNDLQRVQKEGVVIHKLIALEEHSLFVKEEILKIQKNLNTKETIVEEQRKHLIFCAQQYKIMDELKKKQNAAYKLFLDKKESAMLDEIAVVRHGKEKF